MGKKTKKILEWLHRLIGFTIFDSLISLITMASLMYTLELFLEKDLLTWGVKAGLIQAIIGIIYLKVANGFYWLFDINLFDFKQWRKK